MASLTLRIRALRVASFLAVMTLLSRAHAEGSAHERAAALFEEGGKLLEAGDCDNAIPKFQASLDAEPSIGARLALAACFEPRDPFAAWRALKDAASLAAANHDERLATAEARATMLEKKLPTFRVTMPPGLADEPGFEFRIDDRAIDKSWLRTGVIAATAGRHRVDAFASAKHWSGVVVADVNAPGEARVVMDPETCVGQPAAAPFEYAERPGSARRAYGIAIGGVGVAGIATGIVFGVITLDKKKDIQSACGGNVGNCSAPPGSLDIDKQAAKTTATVSTVAFIAGAVALIGGGALYLTAPSGTPKTGSIQFAPQVGQRDASLTVVGSF